MAHAVNAFITELVNIHNYYHTFLKGGAGASEVPRSDPEFLTSMKRTDDPMNMITVDPLGVARPVIIHRQPPSLGNMKI